ncbi:hypothetical protein [Georgenia sp. SYP-B2076]|uniref:hypothetical protein n=1 Tax=Georgenia sp. SYP-B2076 TaxID=2495881 RepID=UPI000F8C3059|nr:hypothetical protein [Georgenia sp. SYP-B2076]
MKGIGTPINEITTTSGDGDSTVPTTTMRHRVRRGGTVAVGIAVVGAVAFVASAASVYGTEEPRALSVIISDAGSSSSDDCAASDYERSFFDGAEVSLTDAVGTQLATRAVDGAPQASERGCYWTMSFADVPESSGYTLHLSDQTGTRQHSFTYSPDRLDTMDWAVWVSVVA